VTNHASYVSLKSASVFPVCIIVQFSPDAGWLVGRLTSPFSTKVGYIGHSLDAKQLLKTGYSLELCVMQNVFKKCEMFLYSMPNKTH